MLERNTIEKITKIQDLLQNKAEGELFATYDNGEEMCFNTIIIDKDGVYVTDVGDYYDEYRYGEILNVNNIESIYLEKHVKTKVLQEVGLDMTVKELLSILDTECVDSVCIIKDNEVLWNNTELITIPDTFLDKTIKLVSPQHNTEYYENYDGEMCEGSSELSVVIEIM